MLGRLIIAIACAIAGLIAFVWLLVSAPASPKRFWRIAIGFDQVANAAIGGDENLTISTRAAIGARANKRHWCVLCKLLNAIEKDHCENSLKKMV